MIEIFLDIPTLYLHSSSTERGYLKRENIKYLGMNYEFSQSVLVSRKFKKKSLFTPFFIYTLGCVGVLMVIASQNSCSSSGSYIITILFLNKFIRSITW